MDKYSLKFGFHLAKVTGHALENIKIDVAFSSPLKRAYQTTELVLNNSDNITTQIFEYDRLEEISMKNWENKRFKCNLFELQMAKVKQFFENSFYFVTFPNGESKKQICYRTRSFLTDLIKNKTYKNVLVSTNRLDLL